jgi:four helix bundle protein
MAHRVGLVEIVGGCLWKLGTGWLFIVLDKGIAMKKNTIRDKSFDFAVRMVGVCTGIQSERKEYVLSKQLLRSSTAIGALIREAQQAESRRDFIHKLNIALKEAQESEYWLLLLKETAFY